MPKDQTIEGGAQIRVTQAGFQKLTSIIPTLINQQLGSGFCVPRGEVGSCTGGFPNTGACYCTQNSGSGCNPGSRANVSLNSLNVSVTSNSKLRISMSATVNTTIQLTGRLLGASLGSCNLNITSNNLNGSLDIALGIKPENGELDLHLDRINSFGLNMDISGCGFLGDIADLVGDLLDDIINSFAGGFVLDLLTPAVDSLIQGFLPDPLGIAGLMDVGNLLAGVSPGTEALMEARIVPGGYVRLDGSNRGMSLGVITGMNADEDITTRSGTRPDGIPLASEPNLCVPAMAPPLFGAAPHNLGAPPDNPARATFFLPPAGALDGMPEPSADIAMGVSETFLDLAGHHLVTSGAMCLGVGTTYINQLNVGTIGILVPSLSELTSDTGKDPLLLVTRPQKPVNFTIGDNTAASPALTLGIQNLEVDFYAFLFERYVRAFTLDLTMNVGVNLEFEQQPGMPAQIKPTLVGISSQTVQVKVLNSEFVRETPQHLEMVLPSVFDLVTPLLGNIGTIQVPEFAGFSLNNLSIQHVVTPQDDFLALYASLGAGTLMRQIAQKDVFGLAALADLDRDLTLAPPVSTGRARLRSVTTPKPEQIRIAMTRGGAAMPEAVFDVDRFDASGRELEYAYSLNGGMYRPYRTPEVGGTLVVRDPAFAWQGKYTIGIKSRVKGDYRTTSAETTTPVIIDSVGPKIATKKMFWDGDTLKIPMFDTVSEHVLTYAFGRVGEDAPVTEWSRGSTAEITQDAFDGLAIDGKVLLYSKDEAGNVEYGVIEFHGQASSEGCSCETGSGPTKSGAALAFLVGVVVLGGGRRARRALRTVRLSRRARRIAGNAVAFVALASISALLPACDCGDPGAKSCELASDCGPDFCEQGQLPFCIDGECVCSDDIIAGRVGAYSDIATGGGQIWVSGYSVNHGDLVVAHADGPGRIPVEKWEYVDGVPDGPVLIPDSKIRGGIDASGDDVGMYTSIAVNSAGEPYVSYFDRDHGSLKFAHKVGDTWQTHVIEQGSGRMLGEQDGALIGMYTSITLRSDDGRPGIAYLAHIKDSNGARAEVRYAAAQTPNPTSAADWQLWIVDSADLPPDDPENPNVYPLPNSLGLFVDSARLANQAPVVAYYDRVNGDLKVAKFNPQSGQFGVSTILAGMDNDSGWSPSVSVSPDDKVHVAYVNSTRDDLEYIVEGAQKELVDDGYRIVGVTVDGLPKPEFHFVGDDASLQLIGGATPWIVYQDATTQDLLLGTKQQDGTWMITPIAGKSAVGEGNPWPGAYGFFAASSLTATEIAISSWVINQPADNPFEDNWVEVFVRPTTIQ